MLTSNSEGGCFPVTRLRTWGWGSPGGWGIPEEWGSPEPELLAPSAEWRRSLRWRILRRTGEWMTLESVSGDSKVTWFFCWSKNFWTRSLKSIWSFESSLCWTLDSWVATLNFLNSFNLNWSSRVRRVIAWVLRIWPSMGLTVCMPEITSLPSQSPNDFRDEARICNFWAGGWDWMWARTRSPKWQLVISEVCWIPSRMMSSHLIWPNTYWSGK